MAGEETTNEQRNINPQFNAAITGLNMDQVVSQLPKGVLTYALNAAVENFDSNGVNYQNESGNELCLQFPSGYNLIGTHFIPEKNKHIFFLTNPETGDSEIGQMINNDCVYRTVVNAKCLNFNINHPIHKSVHRITNCTTEVYWTDGLNPRRYIDLENIPYKLLESSDLCDPIYTQELDCNQLKIQPNFSIPQLEVIDVVTGGDLTAGTYQFAIQYSDAIGNPYTSYYSVTNPTPIANPRITTPDFNYNVGKSIILNISNLDNTGQWQYFNLAVIKTVNNIPSVELVGTFFIDSVTKQITYTGQNVTQIRLTVNDIFEKFQYYDIAQDLTSVQDILIWDNLTSIDRINYQQIANKITLGWQSWRIPATENYANEVNATNLRGYLRDEVYAFEIVFLLKNGKQTDGFHIPGRIKNSNEFSYPDIPDTNDDFVGEPDYYSGGVGYSPYWKIYNTGSVTGFAPEYDVTNINYKGPYQYGEFAYWESTELYPCNDDVWGDLAGQPIRHHKFPDVLVSPIFESKIFTGPDQMVMGSDAVFPIGVRLDTQQIKTLISISNLTPEQKDDIVGFKIVRGDRGTNKSIIAKGMLRNVNVYERNDQKYYYANYPYNDLNEDVFLNSKNNAYNLRSEPWLIICRELDSNGECVYEYTDINTNKQVKGKLTQVGEIIEICSLSRPIFLTGKALIGPGEYDVYNASACGFLASGYRIFWDNPFTDNNLQFISQNQWISSGIGGFGCDRVNVAVEVDGIVSNNCFPQPNPTCNGNVVLVPSITQPANVVDYIINPLDNSIIFLSSRRSSLKCKEETPQPAFNNGYRQVFNSPETSFGNPFLGNVLKLENVIYGAGKAHFVEVEKSAKYKLLSKEAQEDALNSSVTIGNITDPFNAAAMFAAYQSYLTIYVNGITRKNYAYSYNSIASYDYHSPIGNNVSDPFLNITGIKQREIDVAQYLVSGVQSVGDTTPQGYPINNWYRESSVFIKTKENRSALPFPSKTLSLAPGGTSIVTDKSRITISSSNVCNAPGKEQYISSVVYYGSMKNIFVNQWGQIYSYDTIDTGFQRSLTSNTAEIATVFGGDTFISRFAYKTKLPFFIDWRVNAPDDSDIFYDEIGNIAYPKYWHSSRSVLDNFSFTPTGGGLTQLYNIISYKAHNFDCPNDPSKIPPGDSFGTARTFYDGYFYLFSYGIPNFYCESAYNVDLRQAFNNQEGDFWPHVNTGIPDNWVQEYFVPIAQDNTYFYNITYSKQNKENFFSHLPPDWTEKLCYTFYPFRAIYSDTAVQNADNRVNNWLIYRATSMFDFPQNFGNLVSLDGIQNKAVLARFENKSLLYNTMLTIQTSNPQAAYMGNETLFKAAPPIDFAETDLGYVGAQNKMLLKVPQGQLTMDAKRGQVFLISGNQATDLSAFKSGLNRFFTDHLAFEILRYFPEVNIDNHFNGVGLHGVYDSKFDRLIITKLDYIPLDSDIKYDASERKFYLETVVNDVPIKTDVYLTDGDFFCNKSWTLSYNLNTKSWISFHSYIPNFYIGENNFFYSGINGCCDGIDANVEFVAGEISKEVTTTTSTTLPIIIIPTFTTLPPPDCDLKGNAVMTDCTLEGSAEILIPPTTTTTICQRNPYLNIYGFYTGYQIGTNPSIDFTGSFEDACDAAALISVLPSPIIFGFSVMAANLNIGTEVYNGISTDCTLAPDGWYLTDEGVAVGFAIHVQGGIITEIQYCECGTTTSTTTTQINFPECCGILLVADNNQYLQSPNGMLTNLNIPGWDTLYDSAAMTSTRLWQVYTQATEWIITTSPFTATFSRNIAFPGGINVTLSSVAKDNNTLIVVDTSVSPEEVTELDITNSPAVVTYSFPLQADRTATSNALYTTTGKYLVANQNTLSGKNYLTQYDYSTGTIELEIEIKPGSPQALYECECNIFVVYTNGDVYVVEKNSPYTLEYVKTIPSDVLNSAQMQSCVTSSLTDNGNTTTTTSTTTAAPLCYCYEVTTTGTCTIGWTDCTGVQQSEIVPSSTITFCARENSVVGYCETGSTISISGGITPCSSTNDCTTTTTTTASP